MHVISTRNVHDALPKAIHYLAQNGVSRESRAGDVIVATHPVTTVFQRPNELCCFWPERDVNPFATLFEGLWMLAGRNDVDYVARFIARMRDFSDDGETLHGAYGERWRSRFGFDQLKAIGDALRENPECRRQILQIWDSSTDLVDPGKDVPCNTIVHFQVNPFNTLDMTVFNRSNDLVWGTYGADAPHFGMLLMYMSKAAGIKPGRYWQISDNFHAYVKTFEPIRELEKYAPAPFYEQFAVPSPYGLGQVQPYDMMVGDSIEQWDADLQMFIDEGDGALGYQTPFFKKVAIPMLRAHDIFKHVDGNGKYDLALAELKNCRATDWATMCEAWITRRKEKALGKSSRTD